MIRIEPITLRFILVILIIIALMIPLVSVFVLSTERQGYYRQAVDDVSQAWSGPQSIAGPLLLVKLQNLTRTSEGQITNRSHSVLYMPSQLNVSHESSHEMRKRGIYDMPVFTANITASAEFRPIDPRLVEGTVEEVKLVFGISDSRGIRKAKLNWNGLEQDRTESTQIRGIGNAIQVPLDSSVLEEGGSVAFELELRGTQRFSVLPVGDQTEVSMVSDWPDPSFDGRYLPDQRDVSDSGFTASWTAHALSRGFPAVIAVSEFENMMSSIRYGPQGRRYTDLGYTILTLNTPYRAVERSIKYGVLFIVMTLVSIVCLELVTKARFHIIQYGVVGTGLVLFFLTLLSLSEHVGFGVGYVLAAALLATMNVAYVWLVTRNQTVAVAVAFVLLVLYVALFAVLQMNEYALLVGTVLLLLLLAALMFATRSLRVEEQAETDQ